MTARNRRLRWRRATGALYRLTGPRRSERNNLHLGVLLCLVAGAINAGGFLAVARYTSHMTGMVSEAADHVVLGHPHAAAAAAIAVLAFVCGAATTALLVQWGRRRGLLSLYALPVLTEAGLLLLFGLLGTSLQWLGDRLIPITVLLLCFIMGLQNAIITKISRAQIRTTHMTGILTDIGIELGRLATARVLSSTDGAAVPVVDRRRLAIHTTLFLAFLFGALGGAAAFQVLGYAATVPIAVLLAAIAVPPILQDGRRSLGGIARALHR